MTAEVAALAVAAGWPVIAEPFGAHDRSAMVPHGPLLLTAGEWLRRHLPERVLVEVTGSNALEGAAAAPEEARITLSLLGLADGADEPIEGVAGIGIDRRRLGSARVVRGVGKVPDDVASVECLQLETLADDRPRRVVLVVQRAGRPEDARGVGRVHVAAAGECEAAVGALRVGR